MFLSHWKVRKTQIWCSKESLKVTWMKTNMHFSMNMNASEESVITLYPVWKNVNNFTRHSLCKRLHGRNTGGHMRGEWSLKIWNSEIKIIFWKYAATTDIRMIIRNVIKTFWINLIWSLETLITKLKIRLVIVKSKRRTFKKHFTR